MRVAGGGASRKEPGRWQRRRRSGACESRPRPPARAQCDPDPARPPARHGQRGQPGGRRWRRAAAARRLRPRPGPGAGKPPSALAGGGQLRRQAGRGRPPDPRVRPQSWGWSGQVSARHSSPGAGAGGPEVCSLRRRPVPGPTTLRSDRTARSGVRPHFEPGWFEGGMRRVVPRRGLLCSRPASV